MRSSSAAIRRAILVSQHHPSNLRRSHIARQIDAHPLLFQPREILARTWSNPAGCDSGRSRLRPSCTHVLVHRRDRTAFAGDLRRDPLENLGRQMRIHQNRQLGLPQHVDEPRRHHHPVRVDCRLRPVFRDLSDGRDSSVSNRNVARIPGRSSTVDNAPIMDYHIKPLCRRNYAERQKQPSEVLHSEGIIALLPRLALNVIT